MKKHILSIIILMGAASTLYLLFKPYVPSADHEAINCQRFNRTIEVLKIAQQKAKNKELLNINENMAVIDLFDGWGNTIFIRERDGTDFFSRDDETIPNHVISLDNKNLGSYCKS